MVFPTSELPNVRSDLPIATGVYRGHTVGKWVLLLGAAKHVEGENVITSVCWASLINSLVHVADFHTPLA